MMKIDELSTGTLVDAGNRAFTRSEVAKKKGDKVEAFRRLAQSRKFIKRALENKPEEKPMKENFEQAYVESQARIALVLAESLGLISEVKSAGEHGASVDPKDRQKAIKRRTERLRTVSRDQSPAATAAGIRAFHKSREEGETADRAVTRQVTAEKEQRQRERGR